MNGGRRGSAARATLALAALVGPAAGCAERTAPRPRADAAPAVTPAAAVPGEKLLTAAVALLARLDDFEEARAYEQVFDRLSQWSQGAAWQAAGWRVDPLLERLPPRLRNAAPPPAQESFSAAGDVAFLRDRRWLADIARHARGSAVDDLAVAENLFRWTVRSLALVGDPPMVPTTATPGTRWFLPGEILLAGRASAPQRAWVFLELVRQAGLEGVMLATEDASRGGLRAWIPALVTGGEAYLFEPAYGMPVPGPGGAGVATARQAAADPSILAALSLPDRPYPVQAQDIARLGVLVAADPRSLSLRMAALEHTLDSAAGLELAVDASGQATRAEAALPAGAERQPAALWDFPWETALRQRGPAEAGAESESVATVLARELAPLGVVLEAAPAASAAARPRGPRVLRPLFAGRVREFRGELDGPDGAKAAYLAARPSREAIAADVRRVPPAQAEAAGRLYARMKEDATYWLGVVTLAEGEYAAAVDYLERMTLEASPDSRWADAARVNVAEAFVGLGRIDDAVRRLREDGSPQRYGSRLRADRLERSAPARASDR